MKTSVFGAAALLAVVGLASPAVAGGHGFIVRQGGVGGSVRTGHLVPPVAGTWHVRTGRSFITGAGQGRLAFGRPMPGYGQRWNNSGFGHTATAPNGFVRYPAWSRYGSYDRGRLASRSGRYPHVPGYGFGAGYGSDFGSSDSGGFVPVPYPAGGYGEPTLASRYSEPPLNQDGLSGSGPDEADPSVIGAGGPRVIVVNDNGAKSTCRCHDTRTSPVVYRFGVGTYY